MKIWATGTSIEKTLPRLILQRFTKKIYRHDKACIDPHFLFILLVVSVDGKPGIDGNLLTFRGINGTDYSNMLHWS